MLEPPLPQGFEGSDELFLDRFQGAIYDVLINATGFGKGLLLATTDDDGLPNLISLDPAAWYPSIDGHVLVTFEVTPDALDDQPNRIHIAQVTTEGGEQRTFGYKGDESSGTIGDLILKPTSLSPADVIQVDRRPDQGGWGTSMYEDLVSLVIELARRYTANSTPS